MLAPVPFEMTFLPLSLSMVCSMLVVVVLPLVPVTRITLYPPATVLRTSLSSFRATLPGKLLPPLKRTFESLRMVFDVIMLKNVLMLIFYTAFV